MNSSNIEPCPLAQNIQFTDAELIVTLLAYWMAGLFIFPSPGLPHWIMQPKNNGPPGSYWEKVTAFTGRSWMKT